MDDFLVALPVASVGFPSKAAAKPKDPKAVNEKPSSSKAPKDEVPKDLCCFTQQFVNKSNSYSLKKLTAKV